MLALGAVRSARVDAGSTLAPPPAPRLAAVAAEVARSRGTLVPVTVRRGDSVLTLTLMPREWSGQGLLGCLLLPA